MKKFKNIAIVSLAIVFLLALFVGYSKYAELQEIKNMPTFMDAPGAVNEKVGDFQLDNQIMIGDKNAPVTLIEFLDYKCKYCSIWSNENMEKFKKDYIDTGKVKMYFVNYPFLGPDSIVAALFAESIGAQSPEKLLEFNTKILAKHKGENKIWATEKYLLNFVKKNIKDLDYDLLEKDVKERKYLFNVKSDFKIASANGVSSVPTFLVNGKKSEYNYDLMIHMINWEIENKN